MKGFREYYNIIDHNADINLLFTGREFCCPGKTCSGVRSHILLHYVLQGSGYAGTAEASCRLTRGALFCFFPDQHHYYRSDIDDPWEYFWVGFAGGRGTALMESCGFSPNTPIQTPPYSFLLQQLFEELHIIQKKKGTGLWYLIRRHSASDAWAHAVDNSWQNQPVPGAFKRRICISHETVYACKFSETDFCLPGYCLFRTGPVILLKTV